MDQRLRTPAEDKEGGQGAGSLDHSPGLQRALGSQDEAFCSSEAIKATLERSQDPSPLSTPPGSLAQQAAPCPFP